MALMKYSMSIYEGETLSRTIEPETPFLSIQVGDSLTCGDTRVCYGKVERIGHWIGPIDRDNGTVRHEIHIYCRAD